VNGALGSLTGRMAISKAVMPGVPNNLAGLGHSQCEGGVGAISGIQTVGTEVTEACFRACPIVFEILFAVFTSVSKLNVDTSIAPLAE
jgi:hypothetical protein